MFSVKHHFRTHFYVSSRNWSEVRFIYKNNNHQVHTEAPSNDKTQSAVMFFVHKQESPRKPPPPPPTNRPAGCYQSVARRLLGYFPKKMRRQREFPCHKIFKCCPNVRRPLSSLPHERAFQEKLLTPGLTPGWNISCLTGGGGYAGVGARGRIHGRAVLFLIEKRKK